MRVKIAASPPLPPVRAWFPLADPSVATITALKSLLCTSLPAFRGVSPSSLRLSIDGFELLDHSGLGVVRDGDLICVDTRSQDATAQDGQEAAASHKRKRRMSTPSSLSSESESTTSPSVSESGSDSETSTSDSESPSVQEAEPPKKHAVQPPTLVPPGYGKPQTRSRNLRRRLKRMHEHEAAAVSQGGPVSGANAVVEEGCSGLLSLSLRNKNKAKNFKSLLKRPLAPKIIFGDTGTSKPLIPPSSRSSLPPSVFVTSVDVEAGLQREKKKRKAVDIPLDYGTSSEADVVERNWAALERLTSERQLTDGMVVGYKALGINPVTCTPEQCLTVGRVVSCDSEQVVVQVLASFGRAVAEDAEEGHTWENILAGDWRVTSSVA